MEKGKEGWLNAGEGWKTDKQIGTETGNLGRPESAVNGQRASIDRRSRIQEWGGYTDVCVCDVPLNLTLYLKLHFKKDSPVAIAATIVVCCCWQ